MTVKQAMRELNLECEPGLLVAYKRARKSGKLSGPLDRQIAAIDRKSAENAADIAELTKKINALIRSMNRRRKSK